MPLKVQEARLADSLILCYDIEFFYFQVYTMNKRISLFLLVFTLLLLRLLTLGLENLFYIKLSVRVCALTTRKSTTRLKFEEVTGRGVFVRQGNQLTVFALTSSFGY